MLTQAATIGSLAIDTPPPHADRSDDEGELVARARRGNVAAFEQLYRANAGRVFALCLRLTGDRNQAVELTQDVFVRAWERLSAFRGEAAFSSWLHRIAVNALLMRARAEKRRAAHSPLSVDAVRSTDDDSSRLAPGARAEQGRIPPVDVEQTIDLERAIAALPPGARRVFVLHDVIGYRHEEIARMTGLAQGTLRAQLHRARRLLMEALTP
jgi:RNA polymerase sigma-70 factor (ECF subfamily)